MTVGSSALRRRTLIGGALAAATASGFAGCTPAPPTSPGSAGSEAPSAGGSATLRFWTYYELAARSAEFPGLIDKYQASHPGIRVELNAAAQNYNTVLKTTMLSGDRPQVVGVPQYLMRDFAAAGMLTDLGAFVTKHDIKSKLYAAALPAGTVDGKVYGIPDALRLGLWFYNPKALTDAGVEPPHTYDELKAAAAKIRAKGKTPILLGLKDLNAAANSFQVICPAFVGLKKMLEASAKKDYTGPEFVAALDFYRKMVSDGILDSRDTGVAGADAQALLGSGEAAMYPSASYSIGTLLKINPAITAFKEPVKLVDKPVVTYWGGAGQMYCLPKDAKDANAAADFLAWWLQPEQLAVQVTKSGLVASMPKANDSITEPLSKFTVDNLNKVEDDGLFYNNYVPTNEAEAWGRAIQEVVSGAKTAQQAIQTTVQAAFK